MKHYMRFQIGSFFLVGLLLVVGSILGTILLIWENWGTSLFWYVLSLLLAGGGCYLIGYLLEEQ